MTRRTYESTSCWNTLSGGPPPPPRGSRGSGEGISCSDIFSRNMGNAVLEAHQAHAETLYTYWEGVEALGSQYWDEWFVVRV